MEPIYQFIYEEKRSKFFCYLYSINNRDEIKEVMNALKSEHKKAKHILRCCRYSNGSGLSILETNENQEPISSMKKLGFILEKKDFKNVGIFIVRYFGGTKLGASHLDHLYLELGLKTLTNIS